MITNCRINAVYSFLDCGENAINNLGLSEDISVCVIYSNTETIQNFHFSPSAPNTHTILH